MPFGENVFQGAYSRIEGRRETLGSVDFYPIREFVRIGSPGHATRFRVHFPVEGRRGPGHLWIVQTGRRAAAPLELPGLTPDPIRRLLLSRVETPLGPMLLGATDGGVCLLDFADRAGIETQLGRVRKRFGGNLVPGTNEPVESLTRELEAYFAGHLRAFRTPLATGGTPFQERAWEALRAIPYGETRSYGEQAGLLGVPRTVRAAARANGANRIAIVIPCHRVVGSDGKLTGYGGGLWRKRYLLDHERAHRAD